MPMIQSIDAKTAKEWLDNNEAIIVDVRELGEHEAKHISGATLIPLGTIEKDKLPELGNKKLIVHCQLGKRGERACEKLLLQHPGLNVYNLKGGIVSWEESGFKVDKVDGAALSIDRQVQIIIGSGVLLGVILGYFIHPGFLLLSGFFGIGLLFAGITGSCRLAMMMSKMPWNKGKGPQ